MMPYKKKTEGMREIAPYLDLGLQLALTVGIFCFLGWWLDKHFETSPWLLVTCSLLGIAAGFYNFFRTINRLEKKKKEE